MADFKGIPDQLTGSLQENVLTLAASSDEYCKLVVVNVPLELYSNKVMRELATAVYNYIHDYDAAPKEHLVDIVEDKLAGSDGEVMRHILENIQALLQAGFNAQFVVNQLSKFVRQQHLKVAVVSIIEAAEKGDVDQADNILDGYRKLSYEQFSPGLKLKEFAGELGIIDHTQPLFQTGVKALDTAGLGPARGELHLFLAPPKKGKTWWLLQLTKQALLSRLRVVYITLEVSPRIIASRLFQSLFAMRQKEADIAVAGRFDVDTKGKVTGIRIEEQTRLAVTSKEGIRKIKRNYTDNTQIARLSDNLIIQGFPTGSLRMKELTAYLENLVNFHRFMPDVVVLDYADLMYIDLRNYRLAVGQLYKELRGLAVDRNFALCTASQTNRASLSVRGESVINESHAAEDFSKIAISDVGITYNQTDVEREVQTARLYVAVARNAKDKWTTNVTQAYSIGQFCMDAAVIPHREYAPMLPKQRSKKRNGADDDDDGEDDE